MKSVFHKWMQVYFNYKINLPLSENERFIILAFTCFSQCHKKVFFFSIKITIQAYSFRLKLASETQTAAQPYSSLAPF